MTEITLEKVKALRDQTAVSIMQCKKALVEADGDLEKAKHYIDMAIERDYS